MAYTINLANGSVLTIVDNGTVNTDSTSLKLIGKNYTGYGEFFNENFVWLLENFSRDIPPSQPLAGQCWWDSSTKVLNVYDGTVFKSISSSTVSDNEPSSGVEGDLWWSSLSKQLYVNDSSDWILIGPSYTTTSGRSGMVIEVIQDTGLNDHVLVSTFVQNVRLSIYSRDATYMPLVGLDGYTSIQPGITLIDDATVSGIRFVGISSDSDKLGTFDANQYVRADIDSAVDGLFSITDDRGIAIGDDGDLTISLISNDATIQNITTSGSIAVSAADGGGTSQRAFIFNPASNPEEINISGNILSNVKDPINTQDAVTKAYLFSIVGGDGSGILQANGAVTIKGNLLPDANNTRNLGSGAAAFNTIYATTFDGVATTAKYADLAERFEADDSYVAGTVVALGGDKEITQVDDDLSDSVFGVISTRPAHLMNAAAGPNETHPPIAMQGRVPVRVIGQVRKGDRLVSAGDGVARAGKPEEITAFNIVGRSLENKYTEIQGVVEATVSMNT